MQKTEWSQRKILRKPSSNISVHSLKMSASAWPFSDSSDDKSLNFSGFSAEELNQTRENFVRGSRDTDSDLSIEVFNRNHQLLIYKFPLTHFCQKPCFPGLKLIFLHATFFSTKFSFRLGIQWRDPLLARGHPQLKSRKTCEGE